MSDNKAALLVASFEYDDSYFRPLKAPAQDVKALSRVLSDPSMGGFGDVKTLVNQPRDALVLAIEEFLDDRSRDDLLLLYFSCHGIKDEDGRLYYAASNTRHNRLVATAIPAYQVNDLIGKSRSRRKVLVLDCCYSGAFSKAFLAKGGDAVGAMEEFRQGQGLVTLTASDAFQYSFEGGEPGDAGVCSVFTRALVEGIETGRADRDGDRLISLEELYDYAYERVRSENPRQNPRIQVEVEGKIIVARNPQSPQPAELPAELVAAIQSPFAGNREYAVRELGNLLHGRNRALALAANDALVKLMDDDSRKVASAAEACLKEGQPPAVVESREPARQDTPAAAAPEQPEPAKQPSRKLSWPGGVWTLVAALVVVSAVGFYLYLQPSRMTFQAQVTPQVIVPGTPSRVDLKVFSVRHQPLAGVVVRLSAQGDPDGVFDGAFQESADHSISGATGVNGEFSASWSCVECRRNQLLIVELARPGFETASGSITLRVKGARPYAKKAVPK